MQSDSVNEFVLAGGIRYPVGKVTFELEVDAGAYEEVADGQSFHCLSLCIDPADDKAPRLVICDADLYVPGAVPEALDGLRLDVDLCEGDEAPKPTWLRPGSLVGESCIYMPANEGKAGIWDPDAIMPLTGRLNLALDHLSDGRYRIEATACHQGDTGSTTDTPDFHAMCFGALEMK